MCIKTCPLQNQCCHQPTAVMPRIGRPTPEEVAEYPREYAVFTQIPGALEGNVEPKVT